LEGRGEVFKNQNIGLYLHGMVTVFCHARFEPLPFIFYVKPLITLTRPGVQLL
jgi:hypothetical protein